MFTLEELMQVWTALVVQEKSVNRLAAKEGQPQSVAAEYRKVSASIVELIRKVGSEVDKLQKLAVPPKK